jgi:hypothetical protein
MKDATRSEEFKADFDRRQKDQAKELEKAGTGPEPAKIPLADVSPITPKIKG